LIVDVEQQSRVAGLEEPHNVDQIGGVGCTRTREGDLSTSHIGLGSKLSVSLVEGPELRTDKVVARREGGGDGDVHTALVGAILADAVRAPLARGRVVALLVDLEPHGSSASVRLGHVHGAGALVRAVDDIIVLNRVPPLQLNGSSGRDSTFVGSSGSKSRGPSTNHVLSVCESFANLIRDRIVPLGGGVGTHTSVLGIINIHTRQEHVCIHTRHHTHYY